MIGLSTVHLSASLSRTWFVVRPHQSFDDPAGPGHSDLNRAGQASAGYRNLTEAGSESWQLAASHGGEFQLRPLLPPQGFN